jgi:hypothetical protein
MLINRIIGTITVIIDYLWKTDCVTASEFTDTDTGEGIHGVACNVYKFHQERPEIING